MRAVRRMLMLPLIAGTVVALIALAAAPAPAQANSCQVERTVGVDHPVPESLDPRCIILKGLGCTNLQDTGGCVRGIVARVTGTPDRVRYCVENYHPLLNASACDDVVLAR